MRIYGKNLWPLEFQSYLLACHQITGMRKRMNLSIVKQDLYKTEYNFFHYLLRFMELTRYVADYIVETGEKQNIFDWRIKKSHNISKLFSWFRK